MTDTDITPVLELALDQVAGKAEHLATGRSAGEDLILFILNENGSQKIEPVDLEEYADRPYSKRGFPTVADAASLIAYVNRHAEARATTIWADKRRGLMTAVLNDHEEIGENDTNPRPGWGNHRVSLSLPHTDDWKLWLSRNGELMSQVAFAEFLEQGAQCITEPDAATFYEIALSLRAHTGVEFKSSYVLESGEMGFRYEETTSATAGRKGELEIPRTFTLEIEPYDGTLAYSLTARLMYRTGSGGLQLGYRLIRPNEVLTAAFDDLSTQVANETALTVLNGSPRAQ